MNSRATLEGLTRRDFGVSNRARGNVSTTNDRAAATAMTMHATGRLQMCIRDSGGPHALHRFFVDGRSAAPF